MTNAARPLALMFMEISPKYRPPMAARETAQVFTPGQKKGNLRTSPAKTGHEHCRNHRLHRRQQKSAFEIKVTDVTLTVRCYEPDVFEIFGSGLGRRQGFTVP
jgi:hypothetical protein